MIFQIQQRYQSDSWQTFYETADKNAAYRTGRNAAKSAIMYGMVRILEVRCQESGIHPAILHELEVWSAGERKDVKCVLVDIDKTICKYDKWVGMNHFGEIYEGAQEFLASLRDTGLDVVIWTHRVSDHRADESTEERVDAIATWMGDNDLYYDSIAMSKPRIVAVVDDRAVSCGINHCPKVSRDYYNSILQQVKALND